MAILCACCPIGKRAGGLTCAIIRRRLSWRFNVQYRGYATLYDRGGEFALGGIRKFIAAVPRDAKVYGLELDSNKQL